MMNRSSPPLGAADVLVIGGGVAGSSCALRLQQLGIRVDVIEKSIFPRSKVCGCCLGGAGLAMLNRLGLLPEVRQQSQPTSRWCASMGNHCLEILLPDSLAIARDVLDPLMLEAAIRAGANVVTNAAAKIVNHTAEAVQVRVRSAGEDEFHWYQCVVIAAGLTAGGEPNRLPWIERPHGPFGVSFLATSEHAEPGVIYMACDDDGYVGLVKLRSGSVDVAAALKSGAGAANRGTPIERVDEILRNSRLPPFNLDQITPPLTTPPLRRTRQAGAGRVLAIGDAAGYVEPFTGEGMTWAMQSAVAAADRIAGMNGKLGAVGEGWHEQLTRLLRRKKRVCRFVAQCMQSRHQRFIAAQTLRFFPGLAQPLLRLLSQP